MASFSEHPNLGDLIEILHKDNTHWAVYMGGGDVVHLAPPGYSWLNPFPSWSMSKVVKQKPLKDVVGGSRCRVNNHLDTHCPPLPMSSIISRVKEKIGAETENSVGAKDFVTHLRYGVAYLTSSKEFYVEPSPGDLIEIFRMGYQDWALYVGGGDVVHLTALRELPETGPAQRGKYLSVEGDVKQELLDVVLGDCPYRVNNKLDKEYKLLHVSQILSEAKKMVGKRIWYRKWDRNSEHFVTYLRYGRYRRREFYVEPNPGDLIEIFRKSSYQHWAIYVGDGYIVHLTADGELPEMIPAQSGTVLTCKGEVKRELLGVVLGGCHYQVNNKLDTESTKLPTTQILHRAEKMVGKKTRCGISAHNCEHFVTYLRYGRPCGEQEENALSEPQKLLLRLFLEALDALLSQ